MGVAKVNASVKGKNAFYAGFLYAEIQIAHLPIRIHFTIIKAISFVS